MKNAVTRTPMGETEYSGSTSPTDAPASGGDVEHVSIDVVANGRYVVTCVRPGEKDAQPKQYALNSREELDSTLDELLGAPEQKQPEQPDVESASAAPPMATPMAAPGGGA